MRSSTADDYRRIPARYRDQRRWILYRNELTEKGEPTKVPYQANGKDHAATTRPGTWTTFPLGLTAFERGGSDGMGYCRAGLEVFFDADGCFDADGNWLHWEGVPDDLQPQAVFALLAPFSYQEISASLLGGHAFLQAANLPAESIKLTLGKHQGYELYVTARFFAMTGFGLTCGDLAQDASDVLADLARRILAFREQQAAAKKAARAPASAPMFDATPPREARAEAGQAATARPLPKTSYLSDSEVMEKLERDERYLRLKSGDTSMLEDPSDSGVDCAVCQRLGFYTGGNTAQMDSCFRMTFAYREEKWGRDDYAERTINYALSKCSKFYDPAAWYAEKQAERNARSGKGKRKVVAIQGASPSDSSEAPGSPDEPPPDQADPQRYTWTDTGNAKRFRDAYRDVARYTSGEKGWRWLENGAWLFDAGGKLALEKAIKIAEAMLQEGWDTGNEKLRKWALRTLQSGALKSMIELASALPPIHMQATEFDARTALINAPNGVIDLRTGELLPHDPEYYFTGTVSVDYDPTARSQVWDDYLAAVQPDPEAREFLQLAAGYTLSGSTREECCFLLTGSGRNGKGAFLLALQKLLGHFATTANFHTFLYSRRDNTVDLASFRGKRLVVAQEAGLHATFNEGQLKTMTGGDKISAKLLYQNPIEFVPVCKIWFASNTLPEVQDDSPGFWSRMIVIPFPVSFAGREDFSLKQRLLEPDVQRAILAWAVEGHLRLQELGRLPRPPMVQKATEEYREDSDPIASFLGERTESERGVEIPSRELYTSYDLWCRGINLRPYSETQFSKKLKALGYHKRVLNGRKFWVGIRLNDR